ncbi:MAG: lytic transglycosylase domain-containing protein [Acetobacteraceae bacterium]
MLAHSARSQPSASAEAPDAEQTAFAIPRLASPGSVAEVSLPTPLTPAETAVARRIFADQAAGRMAAASRIEATLTSTLLAGPIAADRLLGRFHHAQPAELRAWLAKYGSQADAPAIRALLARRLPHGATMPPDDAPATLPADASSAADPDEAVEAEGAGFGQASRGERKHARAALLAGFASWRAGKISRALSSFKHEARASDAPASMRATGAFWAARAALRLHDVSAYYAWLGRAAAERRTFHGLLARRILGWGTGLTLGHEVLSQADVEALAAMPRGERAFALLQAGQTARAEAELRALWPPVADSAPLRRSLLLAAAGAHLTDLAAQLAGLVQAADGVPHDALRFPVPRLRPAGGFVVNKALVYGLTRTESNFDAKAVSPAGARGLMQIMPATARAVSGRPHLKAAALHDPGVNLGLGQRVLLNLAGLPSVHNSLIRLLGSYNAGASGFADAASGADDMGDPILFIDSIPIAETRGFVRRVLANSWIYAARLGLPAPGLDDLAAGRWPHLAPENWTLASGVPHSAGGLQLARSEP